MEETKEEDKIFWNGWFVESVKKECLSVATIRCLHSCFKHVSAI
jgi:hypothetical protein